VYTGWPCKMLAFRLPMTLSEAEGHFCYTFNAFDTVGWASGRASGLYKTEWWGVGMVICLGQIGCLLKVTRYH